MAYATLENLKTRFSERRLIQLTDRFTPPANAIDETVTAEALKHADDMIDGYVRTRYDLPFAQIPAMLNGIACDIAYFRLFQEPTEEARNRYKEAQAQLRDIASGKLTLPVADGQEAPSKPAVILTTAEPRRMSRGRLEGM